MKLALVLFASAAASLQSQTFESDAAQLWEAARIHSPEIRMAQSERRAAEARAVQNQLLLRANPELEMALLRGSSETGAVLDPELSGPLTRERQGVSGYELGFSQEIETGGQRAIRLQTAEAEMRLFRAREEARMREVRSGLRSSLLRVAALDRLRAGLDRQAISLRQIASAYRAAGMRDSRFGTYTLQAIESDLALLDVERNGVLNDFSSAQTHLFQLCGKKIALNAGSYGEEIDSMLPPAPALEVLLEAARTDSPHLLEARQMIVLSRDETELAGRSIYPSVTLFAGIGVERKGRDSVAALPPITSGPQGEFERRVRFGIRLPVPLFDRGQGRSRESREGEVQAQIRGDRLEAELLSSIESHVSRYQTGRQSLARLKVQIAQAPFVTARLDAAFLGGRLSYAEFWSERSRWMEMERSYYDILQHTMESRMSIEILTGVDFQSLTGASAGDKK